MAATETLVCGLCEETHPLLFSVNGKTSIEMNLVIGNLFPILDICRVKKICRCCWQKSQRFYKFKRSVENIYRKRQLSTSCTTPEKQLNVSKRQKLSVAQQLKFSTQKMTPTLVEYTDIQRDTNDVAVQDLPINDPNPCTSTSSNASTDIFEGRKKQKLTKTPKKRMPVIEGLVSSLEKMKVTCSDAAEESHYKSRKQLFEHSYSNTVRNDVQKVTAASVNSMDAQTEIFIQETTVAVSLLSSNKASVLSAKSPDELSTEALFENGYNEMSLNVPFLFALLKSLVGDSGNKKATMAMIYGIILNSRNRRVAALERCMTVLAIKCHADNKLLSRLNKLSITLSAESKSNIINDCSDHCEDRIVQAVAAGSDGKLNGDNVDIYVTTNDIRMNNKNRDYHFFATDWTPFRITPSDFVNHTYLKDYQTKLVDSNITVEKFHPDLNKFRENIKLLVARDLINHLQFKWMELVVPKHIHHVLEDIMIKKSFSYCMPILLENEARYEDCINIMESYEYQLAAWYRKGNRDEDFACIDIPVGGDQLTRVRLDGAKSLRIGAHTREERFQNLYPVVVEMFHVQMDFLEKTVTKFMSKPSGRDEGTLMNMKTLLQRSSVNLNVKSRFKAHEEFVLLSGKAYVMEAALEFFGMESMESEPTQNQPPDDVHNTHYTKRLAIFNQVMDGFMDTIMGPLNGEEASKDKPVTLKVSGTIIQVPVRNGEVEVHIQHHAQNIVAKISMRALTKTGKVNIPVGSNVLVEVSLLQGDDLQNYILNFLQYYFVLINFKDAIAEGDIFRTSNMLKHMIPFFFRHSFLSKYMIECIDFVLKTEIMLSPKMGIQVRVASFVNPKGKEGKNKPADMQKENQVKELKDLIRGLGANKTENSIVKLSKAYPVIHAITLNIDAQIGYRDNASSHKSRCEQDDLECLMSALRELRPFKTVHGRKLDTYTHIKSSVFHEIKHQHDELQDKILYTANRLKRGLPMPVEEQGENELNDD